MPTIPALVTATQTKLDAADALIASLESQLEIKRLQLEQAQAQRRVLRSRLEALTVLASETP